MRLLLTTLLVWTLAVFGSAHAQCGPRVRKNWNVLTAQEKDTFKRAIAMAMDSGAYIRFIEMHTEMMSEMEAHGQCMFVYWHRMFVLVFENMLRGQSSEFACVTVPYWDWITDNSRFMNSQCRSMGACSTVLQDLGGVPSGMRQSTLSINGIATTGFCVNSSPLDHFCESTTRCSRCVTRGNWNAIPFPATTSYASVMNQLFSATSIGQMSPNLEKGAHNKIHSDLDGALATLASLSDPIFWAHHGMVDLLHVVFHKCRVGTTQLTFQQKATHPVAWSSCGRRNGAAFNPTDVITMRTGGGTSGRPVMPGSQDPVIGRYFQGVPNRYADLMDVRDLGYSYELSGVVTTMYSQCDGRTTVVTAPQPATVTTPQTVTVTAPRPATVTTIRPATVTTTTISRPAFSFNWPSSIRIRRSLRAATQFGDEVGNDAGTVKAAPVLLISSNPVKQVAASPAAAAPAPLTSSNPAKQVAPAASVPEPTPVPEAVSFRDTPPDPSVTKVIEWYSAMLSKVGGPSPAAFEEIERMMCAFQDECEGVVKDYTPEFKNAFDAEVPRCKAMVDDLRAGKTSISVSDWKETMTTRFGCAQPEATLAANSPVQKSNSPVQKT